MSSLKHRLEHTTTWRTEDGSNRNLVIESPLWGKEKFHTLWGGVEAGLDT